MFHQSSRKTIFHSSENESILIWLSATYLSCNQIINFFSNDSIHKSESKIINFEFVKIRASQFIEEFRFQKVNHSLPKTLLMVDITNEMSMYFLFGLELQEYFIQHCQLTNTLHSHISILQSSKLHRCNTCIKSMKQTILRVVTATSEWWSLTGNIQVAESNIKLGE